MTIEQLIQENTYALRDLHGLLSPVLVALLEQKAFVKQERGIEEVKEEVKEAVKKATKKKEVKPEPVKELEPAVEDDDPLAEFEITNPIIDRDVLEAAFREAATEEVKSVLPAGKRDAAFYEANVKPVLAQLAKLDTVALVGIVRDQYGVKKADMIPTDQWDDLVTKVQAEINAHSVV